MCVVTLLFVTASLSLVSSTCTEPTGEGEQELERRTKAANELKDALVGAGMVIHSPLVVKSSPGAGVGLFVAAGDKKIGPGDKLFELPSRHFFKGDSRKGLASSLLAERNKPSSKIMELYIKTLPSKCPNNIAIRPQADLDLLSTTIHKWKVDLLQKELASLAKHHPSSTTEDRQWACCMVLSRALLHNGQTVLMPFVDLLNHGDSCASAVNSHTHGFVATRTLSADEQLAFAYVESPSRARLLSSFGFEQGAPAASLAAHGLPNRDQSFLVQERCAGEVRTDLFLDSESRELTEEAMRDALRCIRLKVYSPAEATAALSTDHLTKSWEGPSADHQSGPILSKDAMIVRNTFTMCAKAQSEDMMEKQALLLDTGAASEDLRAAVQDETAALVGCAHLLNKAAGVLHKRLGG